MQQGATGEVLVTKAKHKLQYMYYKTSPTPKQALPNVHLDEGRLYRWTPLGAIRNPRTGKLRQKHGKTITQDEIQRNITSEEPRPLSPKSRASKRQHSLQKCVFTAPALLAPHSDSFLHYWIPGTWYAVAIPGI